MDIDKIQKHFLSKKKFCPCFVIDEMFFASPNSISVNMSYVKKKLVVRKSLYVVFMSATSQSVNMTSGS